MMKLRLRASIFPLFSSGKRSISDAFSTKPILSNGDVSISKSHAGFKYFMNSYFTRRISHLGVSDKFPIKRTSGEMLSSLPRYDIKGLHSSSDEEDEFAELGLPVSKEGDVLQLLTEKLEKPPLKKYGDPSVRRALETAWRGKNKSIKDLPQKKVSLFEAFRFDTSNDDGVSTTASCSTDARKDKDSRTIRIKKVPFTINICQLRKVASNFGEISSAYMSGSNGSYQDYHVEYKSAESKKRAIAAEAVTLNGISLPISNLPLPENIAIRISNISKDTAEASIHSICKACGPLKGLKRTTGGSLDAFFNAKDTPTKQSIVNRLNDTVVDGCLWSAKLVSGDNTSTTSTNTVDNAQCSSQFTSLLSDIKNQFEVKKIYLQDLEVLHDAIVHLQETEANC